ncbi:uncharacterized protein TNCV_1940041 [Trichonephila clavipes]|nr:uncharacterized protein TNCV_1940041 [Trichonephila clavipes]
MEKDAFSIRKLFSFARYCARETQAVRSAGCKCLPVPDSDEVCPPVCARIPECSCVSSINLKAGNRINDLANVCILSENCTTEVSEPVNKCRFLNNPVVNKSVENATSCDFEKENCDPPVRCTNVSHPFEVGRKEFNVNRSGDCDVKMKVGICEGRVRTVRMGAQRVINPVNIGVGSFELKRDKGVANPEGLICENSCEKKYTLGTLRGCEKQLTVNRIHTIAKIAGPLKGKEDTCKADGLTCLEDGLAMRLPLRTKGDL